MCACACVCGEAVWTRRGKGGVCVAPTHPPTHPPHLAEPVRFSDVRLPHSPPTLFALATPRRGEDAAQAHAPEAHTDVLLVRVCGVLDLPACSCRRRRQRGQRGSKQEQAKEQAGAGGERRATDTKEPGALQRSEQQRSLSQSEEAPVLRGRGSSHCSQPKYRSALPRVSAPGCRAEQSTAESDQLRPRCHQLAAGGSCIGGSCIGSQ